MKFFYKFWNLLGTVYRKGNLIFSPDGNSVISPVGNKITIYDLKNNKSRTLDIESRFNYTTLDISPNGMVIVAVNEEGEAHFISLTSKTIIRKYRFNGDVTCIKFSPDGKYFAASKNNNVFVFKAFGNFTGEFNPFEMVRVFHNAQDDITCLEWSCDSKVLAAGSKDSSVKLYPLEKYANFKSYSLGSHKDMIISCFFENDSLDMYTISKDSLLCVWECSISSDGLIPYEGGVKKARISKDSDSEDDIVPKEKNEEDVVEVEEDKNESVERIFYKRITRMFLTDSLKKESSHALISSAAYHKSTHILVTGYSNGFFSIHELPSITLIHTLSISEHDITAVSLNNTGDWIALGSSTLGQLLVWEWQSETYVMKQQGHMNNMTCLTYSSDGMYIATGGYDGKVKLWNTSSGFCFVTFNEHSSNITGLKFSNNRKFVVSASLDGTVRAFDLTRYRNFKTFTSPRPVQFACVAIDSNGEFIAAGCQDVFEIYLWSMKIGRLCEILSGHEGPVVSLAFNPILGITTLASVSWDKTLKIWNAIESGSEHETFQLPSDGLAVAYRPDGEEVAVATLNSQITFINVSKSIQMGSIEGRNDLGSGVLDSDLISAKKSLQGKAFSSLCYTADGSCVLAGGNSKNVCIYNTKEKVLIKKFTITQNRSLDGIDDFINRRKLTEFGNIGLIEERDGEKTAIRLPGVREGDMSSRASKPEIRVFQLEFSPTGQAWAAATTEGLLIYSLDLGLVFDPFQLDFGITPETVKETVRNQEFSNALMMAIKLGEKSLIQYVIENVPSSHVELCVLSIADVYVTRCIKFIVDILENSTHIEFYLIWIKHLLTIHGKKLKNSDSMPVLVSLQKNLLKSFEELEKICDFNKYTMQFLSRIGKLKLEYSKSEKMEVDVNLDSEDEVELLAA